MKINTNFKPAWWLPSPHLQTMIPPLLRRSKIKMILETIELSDGDFLELMWTEKPVQEMNKPIVILLHGIEGSYQSHYIKGITSVLKKRGWIGVIMHFRGCGVRPNRKPHSYHSGDTKDLSFLVNRFQNNYPSAPLAAVGFSLGGNVLTKFLGENERSILKAAVVVSAPLDLAACVDWMNHRQSFLYQKFILKGLLRHLNLKIQNGLISHLSTETINDIKSLRQFDEHVTVPLYGFKCADDYYQKSSGKQFLKMINVPTLVIHSLDDPFLNPQLVPSNTELSEAVTFEVTNEGGHVGFVAGNNPFKPEFWLEKRTIEFLSEYL